MAYDFTDFNETFYRGNSESFDITITLADKVTPRDITGWTLWCTAKLNVLDADAAAIFQRTTAVGGGIAITNATQGKARISIIPANTETLTEAKTTLFADVQSRDAAGLIGTPLTGKFVVVAEVTRATT